MNLPGGTAGGTAFVVSRIQRAHGFSCDAATRETAVLCVLQSNFARCPQVVFQLAVEGFGGGVGGVAPGGVGLFRCNFLYFFYRPAHFLYGLSHVSFLLSAFERKFFLRGESPFSQGATMWQLLPLFHRFVRLLVTCFLCGYVLKFLLWRLFYFLFDIFLDFVNHCGF